MLLLDRVQVSTVSLLSVSILLLLHDTWIVNNVSDNHHFKWYYGDPISCHMLFIVLNQEWKHFTLIGICSKFTLIYIDRNDIHEQYQTRFSSSCCVSYRNKIYCNIKLEKKDSIQIQHDAMTNFLLEFLIYE